MSRRGVGPRQQAMALGKRGQLVTAEGWLGPFDWLPEHLQDMSGRQHAIPSVSDRPKGSLSAEATVSAGVASPVEARAMLKSLLAMPPLSLSNDQFAELRISTHSFHGSGPTQLTL